MITPEEGDEIVISYSSGEYCERCKGKKLHTICITEDYSEYCRFEYYFHECLGGRHTDDFIVFPRTYQKGVQREFYNAHELMNKQTFYEKFIKDKIKTYNLF